MTSAEVNAEPLVLPKLPVLKQPSHLHVDIDIQKRRDGGLETFGKSAISLSGTLAKQAVVTDQSIRIYLPDDSGIRVLNLIYNKRGKPEKPKQTDNPVRRHDVLTQSHPELVQAVPVSSKDAVHILDDIQAGDFELVATAPGFEPNETNAGVNAKTGVENLKEEFQLIYIFRTGEYFTYNTRTRKLHRVKDRRAPFNKRSISNVEHGTYSLVPNDFNWNYNWNYSFNDEANYYRKYLIQSELESKFPKIVPPKFNKYSSSLPERNKIAPPLERKLRPFSDDSLLNDPLYQRILKGEISLKRSNSERQDRPRLTRSNVLRHEFLQKTRPLPSWTEHLTMDTHRSKGSVFDADDALQEQNLKCPVCKNFYDTRERNPRIMQCLHSTCEACLKSRIRAEMVQCPVCSEVHEVPNNDKDLLPVDQARQHLVKFFKVRNRTQEIGCDSCDPRNRASHRCRECDEFLCGVCTEAHKRTKVTKGHNVVAVEALKRSNLDEFHHKRTCPIQGHEDQHFSFYCYSKGCDQPICSLCAVTEHNKADGHDIRNINDVYVENKRLVESLMIDIRHKKNLADEAIQSIEDEIQNLYIKENSTEEELDQAFLACQKQLEKRKNELKEKLAATSKAKKKGMESQLDKLISEKNSLDHAAKFSGNVLGYSDATEFLQMKDSLFSRLGELKEMDIDSRPHNKADIKFHAHKMLDAFQKFSNKMGEVWSTTAFIPNTKIQTYDIGLGREETAMMITLHDYEKRPLAEPGVDIRVEVMNPMGKKSRAQVIDLTDTEGAYKVLYQGTKLGDHRASVFVMGMPVIDPGVAFKVRRHGALEDDVIRDYETGPQPQQKYQNVPSKIDTGLRLEDDDYDEKQAKTKSRSYRVFGDIICPDFQFDGATCHPQDMVSSDSRTLKNIRGRTANIGSSLKNYRGVIGNRPFSKTGRFYFEVTVQFFIKRQLRNDLIFEVALSRKSEIDKNYTVDGSPYAWTVSARRCALCRTICLMAFHNGVRLYHNKLTENSPPGTSLRTTIGFLVDMNVRQWFIVDAKNRRLFFRFKNIDTSKPLWPVFGAYSMEYVTVSMLLKTGKDIQAVPDIPADI